MSNKYSLKFALVAAIAMSSMAFAFTMPKWLGKPLVDIIMDFGDKHIHGPFSKDHPDQPLTRQLVSDVVMPVRWYRIPIDIFGPKYDTHTATQLQDTPGWTRHGVVGPKFPQPAPKATNGKTAFSPFPSIPINREIHPAEPLIQAPQPLHHPIEGTNHSAMPNQSKPASVNDGWPDHSRDNEQIPHDGKAKELTVGTPLASANSQVVVNREGVSVPQQPTKTQPTPPQPTYTPPPERHHPDNVGGHPDPMAGARDITGGNGHMGNWAEK